MSGKTHAAVGAVCGLTMAIVCSGGESIGTTVVCESVVFSVVGALFADVDTKQSKGAKLLSKVVVAVACACAMTAFLFAMKVISIKSIVRVVEQFGAFLCFLGVGVYASTRPHREFSHSFFTLVLTTFLVYITLKDNYWIWYGVGYCSHLMVDLLNGKGENLFFPLSRKYCLGLCKADGVVNRALFYGSITVIAILLCLEGVMLG